MQTNGYKNEWHKQINDQCKPSIIHMQDITTIKTLDCADISNNIPRSSWSAGFLAGGVLDCNLAHRRSVAELCMLFKIKSIPMHILRGALVCAVCRCVLLVVLRLLIGTRSRLLVVGLLSIAEPLCHSRCLFGTILVTLCLMVWDWLVSRAEPMLSCWHDLLFLFWLLLFYIFLPSMGWFCGLGLDWYRVLSLPALHTGLQIIIIICFAWTVFVTCIWTECEACLSLPTLFKEPAALGELLWSYITLYLLHYCNTCHIILLSKLCPIYIYCYSNSMIVCQIL